MNWHIGALKKYAMFEGRARRMEYWMFCLFNMIIAFGLTFLSLMAGRLMGSDGSPLSGIVIVYDLAVLVPGLAVGVRRMHDTGHSGWWLICPIVNLVFAFTDSQPGTNEYGTNPKGVVSAGAGIGLI